ncbi:hypothetical protein JCM8208_006589 [Rhodotorula glutinis]
MDAAATTHKEDPASDEQPCEVCGAPTRRCCAACQAAGLAIFFCSKDHQKLVWPVHKPVCGPGKAFPMVVMPLTDLELNAARVRLDHVAFVDQPIRTTLRTELRKTAGKAAELVLDDLGGDVYDTSKLSAKPWLVHIVRTAVRFYSATGSFVTADPLADQLLHLFGEGDGTSKPGGIFEASRVSYLFVVLRRRLGFLGRLIGDQVHEPWFSLLSHKVLLTGHLRRLSGASPESLEARSLAAGATARFDAWIRGGMGTDDDRFISALREWAKV